MSLMCLLADCVSSMTKEDIKTHQSNLFSLFLEVLDFRVQQTQEVRISSIYFVLYDEGLLRLHGLLSTCKSVNSYFFGIFQDDDDLVDKTEGRVIEAFLCLVVKLSEVSFRPMFLRVRVHMLCLICFPLKPTGRVF